MSYTNSSGLVLDWNALGKLSKRPRLEDVVVDPQLLSDGYYQVSGCEFLHAAYQWDEEFTAKAVHVGSFLWASSKGSFLRAVSRKRADLELDDGVVRPLPSEFRLAPDCVSYGAIMAYLFENVSVRSYQSGLYDEKSLQIGSYVQVDSWSYLFRSSRPVPADELPFAVKLQMNKRLLIPC